MANLVNLSELLTHAPLTKDGEIIGCRACHWSVNPLKAQTFWTQYLWHLPQFRIEGHLELSGEDMKWLAEMEKVFR